MSDPATKTDVTGLHQEIELFRKELEAALLDMKLGVIKAIKAALFKIVGLLGGVATLLFLLDKLS